MTNKTLESSKIKENELKKDHEKHDKNGKGDFKDVLTTANDVDKLTFNENDFTMSHNQTLKSHKINVIAINEMISVNNVNIKHPRKMI